MSTASLTFPMADAGGDLVFSGVDDGTPYGLLSMTRVTKTPQLVFADRSQNLDGEGLIGRTFGLASITAEVEILGTSQAELETRIARMETCADQFRYPVVQDWNGSPVTWQALTATVTPGEIGAVELDEYRATFTLTIPVQPNASA